MQNKSLSKGFTLVELMVVITIIVILTGVVLVNLSSAKAKSRDAKRIADLASLQLALEQYFDKNQFYPSDLSALATDFISVIPKDPRNVNYDYAVDSANRYDYVIHAKLEASNSIINDGIAVDTYAVTCNHTLDYCVGPK